MRTDLVYFKGPAHQESSNKWHNSTICRQTVGNGSHSVLTDTISDICAGVCAEASARGLKVNASLDLRQVTTGEISRTTNEIREGRDNRGENNFGEFSRGLGGICGLVNREVLLPTFGELAGDSSCELRVLFGVFLAVGGEERIPLCLSGCSSFAEVSI